MHSAQRAQVHYNRTLLRSKFRQLLQFKLEEDSLQHKQIIARRYYYKKQLRTAIRAFKSYMQKRFRKSNKRQLAYEHYNRTLESKGLQGFFGLRKLIYYSKQQMRKAIKHEMFVKKSQVFIRWKEYQRAKKCKRNLNIKALAFCKLKLKKLFMNKWLHQLKQRILRENENNSKADAFRIQKNMRIKEAICEHWAEYSKLRFIKAIQNKRAHCFKIRNTKARILQKWKEFVPLSKFKKAAIQKAEYQYTKCLLKRVLKEIQNHCIENKAERYHRLRAGMLWARHRYLGVIKQWKKFQQIKREERNEIKKAVENHQREMQKVVVRKWMQVGQYWINKKTSSYLSAHSEALRFALKLRNKSTYSGLLDSGYGSIQSQNNSSQKALRRVDLSYISKLGIPEASSFKRQTFIKAPASGVLKQNVKIELNAHNFQIAKPVMEQKNKTKSKQLLQWLDSVSSGIQKDRNKEMEDMTPLYQETKENLKNTFNLSLTPRTPHSQTSVTTSLQRRFEMDTLSKRNLSKDEISERIEIMKSKLNNFKVAKTLLRQLKNAKREGDPYNAKELARLEVEVKEQQPLIKQYLQEIKQYKTLEDQEF